MAIDNYAVRTAACPTGPAPRRRLLGLIPAFPRALGGATIAVAAPLVVDVADHAVVLGAAQAAADVVVGEGVARAHDPGDHVAGVEDAGPVVVPVAEADGAGGDDAGAQGAGQLLALVDVLQSEVLVAPHVAVVADAVGQGRVVDVARLRVAHQDAGHGIGDGRAAIGVPHARHRGGLVAVGPPRGCRPGAAARRHHLRAAPGGLEEARLPGERAHADPLEVANVQSCSCHCRSGSWPTPPSGAGY